MLSGNYWRHAIGDTKGCERVKTAGRTGHSPRGLPLTTRDAICLSNAHLEGSHGIAQGAFSLLKMGARRGGNGLRGHEGVRTTLKNPLFR